MLSDPRTCLAGIRQIEIDVFADPNGTLFTTAAALKLAGGSGTLASAEYRQPGFKVRQLRSPAQRGRCRLSQVIQFSL